MKGLTRVHSVCLELTGRLVVKGTVQGVWERELVRLLAFLGFLYFIAVDVVEKS